MSKLWRVKFIAFSVHLLISGIMIGSFMLVVTQLWYPGILFELENVWEGLQILIPVDATLGPLLTLILFAPGKKGLIADLSIVAFIQILALVLGGLAIYSKRPVVFAFTGDRFEIISSLDFNRDTFARDSFKFDELPYPLVVYALPGQTPKEISDFTLNNIQYQKLSDRYRPPIDYQHNIREKSLSLSKFVPANEKSTQILNDFKAQPLTAEPLLFILEGTTSMAKILVLDGQDLSLINYLDLDPWTEYQY